MIGGGGKGGGLWCWGRVLGGENEWESSAQFWCQFCENEWDV